MMENDFEPHPTHIARARTNAERLAALKREFDKTLDDCLKKGFFGELAANMLVDDGVISLTEIVVTHTRQQTRAKSGPND